MIKNKNIVITLAAILFLLSLVSSECNETQVDINSASLEDLDKIVNVGPARAQQIVSLRPFESVDDLINVVGIGNATLEEIRQQGLACVNDSRAGKTPNNSEQTAEEIEETPKEKPKEKIKEPETFSYYLPEDASLPKITVNSLNSQTIKTPENEQENSRTNYAVYGLAGFCILLTALFAIKIFRKNKNEFRE